MNIRERHEEFLQKVRTGVRMTQAEIQEAEQLGKILESERQAAQDPEVIREHEKTQTEITFRIIFGTIVQFPNGTKHLALDTVGNREQIAKWVHPGEQIGNPQEWFTKTLKESPSLVGTISWTPYLSFEQRKAQAAAEKVQAEKDAQALRSLFAQVCRTYGISEIGSNFDLWSSVRTPVAEQFPGKPYVCNADGDELYLIPATQAEHDKWQEERFQAHYARKKDAAMRNDLKELRALAAIERENPWLNQGTVTTSSITEGAPQTVEEISQNPNVRRQTFEEITQQRKFDEIRHQFERDWYAGLGSTPLPQVYDAATIQKWTPDQMRQFLKRYGGARVLGRLNGIEFSTDGGTIKFLNKEQ